MAIYSQSQAAVALGAGVPSAGERSLPASTLAATCGPHRERSVGKIHPGD